MVPGQPTGVTATRKTSSGNTRKIDVAFTAPASGGSPTGYRLYSIPSAFSSPSTCKETAATSVTADRTACLAITALSTATACEAVLGSTAAVGIAAGATKIDAGAANSIELASADPSIYAGQKLRLADKSGQTCAAAPKGSDLVVASVSGAVITFTTDLTAGDSSANANCEIIRGPVCTYAPRGDGQDLGGTTSPFTWVGGSAGDGVAYKFYVVAYVRAPPSSFPRPRRTCSNLQRCGAECRRQRAELGDHHHGGRDWRSPRLALCHHRRTSSWHRHCRRGHLHERHRKRAGGRLHGDSDT